MRPLRLRRPFAALALAAVGWTCAGHAAPLPSLWTAPASKLDLALVKPPYAFVARPPTGQRFNGVDLVTLDRITMQPLTRSPIALSCLRVHASRDGQLLCFTNVAPDKPTQFAGPASYVYSPDLAPRSHHSNDSAGQPNRARMSADGKYGATTEFSTGHSYAGTGGATFSTLTLILSNEAPNAAWNIEKWNVSQDGRKVTSPDLNLWGVTFDPANSDHFFVTAYFAGKPHLAEGSVGAQRIAVVRDSVECPSFSPDGKRLAFKKRTSETGWSPAVLELSTMKESVFDIGNSVDDQIEWLDDHTLVYEVVTRPLIGAPSSDLMSLDVSQPKPVGRLWLERARSPALVRGR